MVEMQKGREQHFPNIFNYSGNAKNEITNMSFMMAFRPNFQIIINCC